MRQAIVFDFDGVIANSIYDSFLTALTAYRELYPEQRFEMPDDLDARNLHLEIDRAPEVFRRFQIVMPLGQRAEHYLPALHAVRTGMAEEGFTQTHFDQLTEMLPAEEMERYRLKFYQVRDRMRAESLEDWLSLSPMFEGMREIVEWLGARHELAIATAKDRQSVGLLLGRYEMIGLFPQARILDKDFAPTKRGHLLKLMEMLSMPPNRVHFIDDKLTHLLHVSELGVGCYLAAWGFNGRAEHREAARHSIPVIEMADLVDLGNGVA